MATQILRINPFDTFFFRDGKPFTMGDDTWADSIFPPSPSVIYGALRTAWISEQKDGFTPENIKESEKLTIKGIFVEFNRNDIALPSPRDLVHEKNVKSNKYLLELSPNRVVSKCSLSMVATQLQDKFVEEFNTNALLRYSAYENYLKANIKTVQVEDNYLIEESKIGIGRQFNTHTTQEGSLYRVDMRRFKDEPTSIVVEIEGLTFPSKSNIRLGGEGKIAQYESIEAGYCDITAPSNFKNNSFKLCLATPSVFEQGWLPKWINATTFEGEYKGIKVKLLAVTLAKPVSIGGFDIQLREPKTMYRAIPSGSVYHFELLTGTMGEVKTLFHYQSISEQKANEGFGVTYVGV